MPFWPGLCLLAVGGIYGSARRAKIPAIKNDTKAASNGARISMASPM